MKRTGLLAVLFVVLFVVVMAKPVFNYYRLSPFKNFPDGFKSKTVKIKDDTVTYINNESDNGIPCSGNAGSNTVIYLSRQWRLNQLYRLKSNLFCVYNDTFNLMDIDSDGKQEVYSDWIATGGGSGALRNIIIWDVNNGSLKPKYNYPDGLTYNNNQDNKITLSDENGKKEYKFLSIGDTDYVSFSVVGNQHYLDIATYIWGTDEDHFGPHHWKLQKFVLSGDTFVKDTNWNGGKDFVTEKKYAVDNNIYSELTPVFEEIK